MLQVNLYIYIYISTGWPKKNVRFWPKICSRCRFWLFRMCFGIRISCLIHLTSLTIPIQNQKCIKNAKNASEDNNFPLAIWSAAETLSSQTSLLLWNLWMGRRKMVKLGLFLPTVCPWCLDSSAGKHRFGLGCRWMHLQRRQSLGCTLNGKGKIAVLRRVFCVFLGIWFWMGIVKVVRWIRLKILIPKHMRKSQTQHLELILAKKR